MAAVFRALLFLRLFARSLEKLIRAATKILSTGNGLVP
jgi:hypothetical protein